MDIRDSSNGRLWREIAVWAVLALLAGAFAWSQSDDKSLDRQASKIELRVDKVESQFRADHDDVVRLKEVVPRIDARLQAIEQQNAEILRELQRQSR